MSITFTIFRWIVDILTPIFTLLMLLSFIIGINRIMTSYNREKYSIIPYLALLLTSFAWIMYGIEKNEIVLYVANILALIIAVVGVVVYHYYSIYPPFLINYLVTFIILFLTLLLYAMRWVTTLGTVAMVFSVIVFGSPLVTVFTVITDGSTESLSFPLAITSLISAALWSMYGGYIAHDTWIVIPSVMGLILVCIQFFLFAVYGISPRENWESTVHHMYR